MSLFFFFCKTVDFLNAFSYAIIPLSFVLVVQIFGIVGARWFSVRTGG